MNTPSALISGVSLRDYLWGEESLFRRYQNEFLGRYGAELTGNVVELGAEKRYNHARFFPNAASFKYTNVGRDCDEYLDITNMNLPDESQDAYVCVSVLEHVRRFEVALAEIERTLKPRGSLLLTVPFAYPHHDDRDYWRFSKTFFNESFGGYESKAFVHLGGAISTVLDVLQRPKRRVHPVPIRRRVYKSVGILLAAILGRFDTIDGFPLGVGLYAMKKPAD